MKLTPALKPILFLVVAVGLLTVSVAVQAWVAPPANPPSCPSNIEGCNAPLHVGTTIQRKNGSLSLNNPTSALAIRKSDASGGYALDVIGSILSDGLKITSNAEIDGKVTAGSLKVTSAADVTGKVLGATSATGDVGWVTGSGGSGGTPTAPTITAAGVYTQADDNVDGLARKSTKSIGTHNVCMISGSHLTQNSGNPTYYCYVARSTVDINDAAKSAHTLNAYAGAGDRVECYAVCLDW